MTTQKRSRLTRAERIAAFAFNPDQLRWPKGTRWGGRWMDMPWKVGDDFLSKWLDFFDGQNTPALRRLARAHLSKPGGLSDTVDRLDKDGLTTPENMADAALELSGKLEALRDDYYRSSVYVDSPEFADEIETSVRKALELSDVSLDEWQQFIDNARPTPGGVGEWDDDADTLGKSAASLPEIDRPGWKLAESGSFETGETEPAYEHESGLAVVQDPSNGTWLVVDENAEPQPFGDDRDFTVFHSVEEAFQAAEDRAKNPPKVVNDIAIPPAGTDPDFDIYNDELWIRNPSEVAKALEDQGYVFNDDLDQWVDPKFLAENMGGGKSLQASAYAPTKPPVEFFKNPQLTEPTPMTVTPDGRVYGHVALWDTCHVGNPEGPAKCTQPPRSKSNYAYFHVGAVETAEGNEVAVGKLVQGTTHADSEATAMQALAHYENTGLAVADVRAGEDRFGIWVSGALRHDLTDAQVKEFRAAPMSGDWRRMRGSLELVAALAVNVPGFPVPRPNGFVASGHVQSLVASGMVPPRKVKAPGSPGALSSEDLQYLKSLAARERANHAAQLSMKVQEVKEADQIKKIKAFAERTRKEGS